jgi:hypothetical protein
LKDRFVTSAALFKPLVAATANALQLIAAEQPAVLPTQVRVNFKE